MTISSRSFSIPFLFNFVSFKSFSFHSFRLFVSWLPFASPFELLCMCLHFIWLFVSHQLCMSRLKHMCSSGRRAHTQNVTLSKCWENKYGFTIISMFSFANPTQMCIFLLNWTGKSKRLNTPSNTLYLNSLQLLRMCFKIDKNG